MTDPVKAPKLPIPPPVWQLPWGQVGPGGTVNLTPEALGFLQLLWSAIQGQGGIIDISVQDSSTAGITLAQIESLLSQDGRAAALSSMPEGAVASLAAALRAVRDFVVAEGSPGGVAGLRQRLADLEVLVLAGTPATSSVASAASTTQWLPLVTGASPAALVDDGAGHLVNVAYHP